MKVAPDEREALMAAAAAAAAAASVQARCSATWRAHSDSWRHAGQGRQGSGSSSESYESGRLPVLLLGEEEEDAAVSGRWRLAWTAISQLASSSMREQTVAAASRMLAATASAKAVMAPGRGSTIDTHVLSAACISGPFAEYSPVVRILSLVACSSEASLAETASSALQRRALARSSSSRGLAPWPAIIIACSRAAKARSAASVRAALSSALSRSASARWRAAWTSRTRPGFSASQPLTSSIEFVRASTSWQTSVAGI
jgi:hypothetical protein